MNPKPGIHTSEFWITAVANIAGAVIAILAAYGLIKENEQQLWLNLIQALAVALMPLIIGLVNYAYINGRTELKITAVKKGCADK